MNRILVTGSRTWTDEKVVREALSDAFRWRPDGDESVTVVHGGARGADRMASRWVRDFSCVGNPIAEIVHHANWPLYGRRAGILRNQQMVDDGAYVCLAFIRDGSRGASHCALAADAAGIPVKFYRETS